MNVELIGALAATLTTVSFLPQAVRVIRTRDTKAISLTMYALFTAGVALWGVYGLLIASRPMIVSNAVTFTLAGIILVLKARDLLPDGGDARREDDAAVRPSRLAAGAADGQAVDLDRRLADADGDALT